MGLDLDVKTWGKKSTATAPRRAIARCFEHYKALDMHERKDWSHKKMTDISDFTQEIFNRYQSGLVLAGFEKHEDLDALSDKYKDKTGTLKTYYSKLEADAKVKATAAIAEADKESEIYIFLKTLFPKMF